MMPDQPANPILPSVRVDGETLIASIRGEIDLHNSSQLRTALLGAVSKYHPKKIILNLGLVPYMDSSAIAVLVEALQRLRKTGGQVVLTNLQPRVKGLLEIARLNTVFGIAASEEDALKK
jgi:anti-sigma B factor antagonist